MTVKDAIALLEVFPPQAEIKGDIRVGPADTEVKIRLTDKFWNPNKGE